MMCMGAKPPKPSPIPAPTVQPASVNNAADGVAKRRLYSKNGVKGTDMTGGLKPLDPSSYRKNIGQ